MKIAIASTADAIKKISNDREVIVLWEGSERPLVEHVSKAHSNAFVIAGVRRDPIIKSVPKAHMTGTIYQNGDELLWYWKTASDGNTHAYSEGQPCPVWLDQPAAIGVLVCLDIDRPLIRSPVIAGVKASSRLQRLLCIPADMIGECGFAGEQLDPKWSGVNVLFCNKR